jgi:hypothetical protein
VAEDGTFRVEDVLPGQYQLYFNATDNNQGQGGEQVAMAQGEATVAEIPGGHTDEPQDVGTFELKAIKRLQVGDPLPALTLADLDGKPIKVEDYKGKHLFLHFWASNHQPSTADMAKLKELYDAFGKDGRLIMVGFNFDRKPEVAKAYVTKNEIKWQQAFPGPKSNIYQELSLRNFPAYILFGPDGKLIAKDMEGATLKDRIGREVAK